jgi:DNA-directed RNA polymerase subunit M/transcription elongation factor TFIIS
MNKVFTCIKCNEEKPINLFPTVHNRLRGHGSVCNECNRAKAQAGNKQVPVDCPRCGIQHMMWLASLQKRNDRKQTFAKACFDCTEVLRQNPSIKIWERYVAAQERANNV